MSEKNEEQPWADDLKELETFFEGRKLPKEQIRLDECSFISDCEKFVSSHLKVIRAGKNERNVAPFIERLQKLKTILK